MLVPTLRILSPPLETPDLPNDTPGASKRVVLTPHDIPRILRAGGYMLVAFHTYHSDEFNVRLSGLDCSRCAGFCYLLNLN